MRLCRNAPLAVATALVAAACGSEAGNWNTAPTRESHVRYFPIDANSAHGAADCNACHGNFDTFTKFDCLGCHDEAKTSALHTGNAGYQYVSTECLRCHQDGGVGVDPAVHSASYFPIATAPHATATCTQCHASATDRKVIDCTSCHEHAAATMTPAHTAVGGFSTGGAGCILCHAEGQVDPVSAHQFGITLGNRHYQSACVRCHDQKRTDKAWAANFSISNCLGCHGKTETDSHHVGRAGYSYTTDACLQCHQDGSQR